MIYLQITAVSLVIIALIHLGQFVPASNKSRRKRYLKRLLRSIEGGNDGIWSMDLRIVTLKAMRESMRRELDGLSNRIKGIEDELKTKEHLDTLIKSVGGFIPDYQPGMTEQEWKEEGTLRRGEKWDTEVKSMLELKHGDERNKLMTDESKKERGDVFKLVDLKVNFEMDAKKMEEQMAGKFSPREGVKQGGIDQEIAQVEEKKQSGYAFMSQIKKELKKL